MAQNQVKGCAKSQVIKQNTRIVQSAKSREKKKLTFSIQLNVMYQIKKAPCCTKWIKVNASLFELFSFWTKPQKNQSKDCLWLLLTFHFFSTALASFIHGYIHPIKLPTSGQFKAFIMMNFQKLYSLNL